MSLARLALVIIGVGLYFGLAIVGEGGFAQFFSHPPLIALAVVTLALSIAALFAGGNVSSGVREDRGNRWVIAAFSIIGLLAGLLPAWCDRINFLTFGGDPIRWAGVLLYAAGGALRLYPVFVLGNRFSGLVAIQAGHTLVTNGVYRVIRHPSYLGLITIMIGWGLAFRSWIGLLLAVLVIPVLVARIRAEEALLQEHFGAEYDAYRARTSRLIPGVY
ncbi:MAG: isoprenylcysteine carboxylmethyltransferase family protein [Candidatus Eremiobacteraeota bacterium]|nr:isoprenylcysteine carboxylmethyltransferase family protein [Candidatus Eremiobacteraeota bacterium]